MIQIPVKRYALLASFVSVVLFFAFFFRGESALTKVNELAAAFAPALSATKSGALDTTAGGDVNGNGAINPGDRLTYTVTINNAGADAATGVNFSDQIDANTTLVNNSLLVSPITSIGNVGITVPAASGLLSNDLNPNGSGAFSITNVNTAGTNGTVSVNTTDGGFTFNPNAGFEGTTTFSYTLSNGTGLTDMATVSIIVSGMIWFVNNNSASCATLAANCGRLSNPFSSLAELQALNNGSGNNPAAGDTIFVYRQTATEYNGALTLLNNQKLVGAGANSTLAAIAGINTASFPFSNALPATGGTNPVISTGAANTNGINLASDNTLRGLTVGNTTGAKLNATASVGTLTVGAATGASDVTLNGNGQAINLTGGGTLAARFASVASTNSAATGITLTNLGGILSSPTTTITNPTGSGISVSGSTSGASFDFGSATANGSGATGVNLAGNAGAITFAALSIAPDANVRALQATNSTGTLTTTGGAIAATGATAIEITNAAGTFPLNIQLTSVSANGGANGIVLTNTSSANSPGGFRILGNSSGNCGGIANPTGAATAPNAADCTGGTIQNTTGADGATAGNGIYLSNAQNVSLTRLKLNDHQNWAIRGTNVNGFTMDKNYITGVNGNNVGADEGSVYFTELTGSATVTETFIEGGAEDNFRVSNSGGTLNRITFTGNTFGFNGTFGNDAILLDGLSTAAISGTVQNCRFLGSRANNIAYIINGNASGDINISGNKLNNTHPNKLGSDFGINIGHTSSGLVTYLVNGNSVNDAGGSGIEVSRLAGGSGTMTGSITNNTVGTAGVANSGSFAGSTIFVGLVGAGTAATHNTTITGNTLRQFTNYGINLTNRGTGGGYLNASVKNNNIAEPSPNSASFSAYSGIRASLGASSTGPDNGRSCLDISGNTLNQTGSSTQADLRIFGRFATVTALPGLNGSVNTFLANQNTITVAPGGFGAVNATSTNPFQSSCPPTAAAFVPTSNEKIILSQYRKNQAN